MERRSVPPRSGLVVEPADGPGLELNGTAFLALGIALIGWVPFGALSPVAIAVALRARQEMRASREMGGTAAYFAIVIGLVGLLHPIWWLHQAASACHSVDASIVAAYLAPASLMTLAMLVAGRRSWSMWVRGPIVVGLGAGAAYALSWAVLYWAIAVMC